VKELYTTIDDLIRLLNEKEEIKFAKILEHRVKSVSWTSCSELFEELLELLNDFLKERKNVLDKTVSFYIKETIREIELEYKKVK